MTKRKNQLLLTLLCLSVYGTIVAQSEHRQGYIERFKQVAIAEMEKSGIPASIKLAQGILESADGKSELAINANNHFGIKCGGNWKGGTYYIKDDDLDKWGKLKKSCFRAYQNPETSYMAHTTFLSDPKKKNRYGFLFNYKNTDYKKWAKGLRKAGYATNPKYPQLLIKIIEDNELYKYDKMSSSELDDKFVSKDKLKKLPTETQQQQVLKHNKVFSHNDVKMVFAKAGDTPLSIARRFGKSVKRIIKYNEINAKTVFAANERVYIQPKRSKYRGKQNIHRVKTGETMHFIAQLYGIKLDKLYKKNKMEKGREPAVSAGVALRKKVTNTPNLLPINGKSINKKTKPSTQPNKGKKSNKKSSNKITHVVKKGDNLYQIARKYGVAVGVIKKLNKLKTNELSIGQKLKIN